MTENTPISPELAPEAPVSTTPPQPYSWVTKDAARHSTRVICDEEDLSLVPTINIDGKLYTPKDIICACIMQESRFDNTAVNHNKNAAGVVTSTDWGICQINDRYHIGPKLDFPSVTYVVSNPDKAVRFMVQMYKAGKLSLWVSYSSDAFKQWL